MSDLISRQAAIDALDGEIEVTGKANAKAVLKYTQMVSDRIKALPPARPDLKADYIEAGKMPEPRWIPVTERSPEIDMTFPHSERYLVQYEDGEMDVASWSNVNRFWTNHVTEPYWNCIQFQTVVAWMPLPQPYERSEE